MNEKYVVHLYNGIKFSRDNKQAIACNNMGELCINVLGLS